MYHSLYEWFNPKYDEDVANNFTTQNFVNVSTRDVLYSSIFLT